MKHERHTCHDCGILEGQIHEYGCDMERCPFCGNQLINCFCVYELLNIDCTPGTYAYEHGLTDEQTKEWVEMLELKGRIPYIVYPNMCSKCGKLWPEMFRVSDEEWAKYIEPDKRDKMLCRECWTWIKQVINESKR